MWCRFFPKFCTLILKLPYIFSNFASGNVNFSTFETIWLILTPRHTFSEEIWTISQQNITLLQNFSSKLISYFRIFGQKVSPEKWQILGYAYIASTPPPPHRDHSILHALKRYLRSYHITLHPSIPLGSYLCTIHPLGELCPCRIFNSPTFHPFGELFFRLFNLLLYIGVASNILL